MDNTKFFYFVKDEEIDPNQGFERNIINFNNDVVYGNYRKIHFEENQNELLKYLFQGIQNWPGCYKTNFREKDKELENYKEKLNVISLKVEDFLDKYKVFEELQDQYDLGSDLMEICTKKLNRDKVELNLILYCLFVNSLGKTTDEKFDIVK